MEALKDELLRPATIVIIASCVLLLIGGVSIGAQAYSWLRKDWRDDITTHTEVGMHHEAKKQLMILKDESLERHQAILAELRTIREGLVAKGILEPSK